MRIGKPQIMIDAGHGEFGDGFELHAGAQIADVAPADLIGQAEFIVAAWVELVESGSLSAGGIGGARGVIIFGEEAGLEGQRKSTTRDPVSRPRVDGIRTQRAGLPGHLNAVIELRGQLADKTKAECLKSFLQRQC